MVQGQKSRCCAWKMVEWYWRTTKCHIFNGSNLISETGEKPECDAFLKWSEFQLHLHLDWSTTTCIFCLLGRYILSLLSTMKSNLGSQQKWNVDIRALFYVVLGHIYNTRGHWKMEVEHFIVVVAARLC